MFDSYAMPLNTYLASSIRVSVYVCVDDSINYTLNVYRW